MARKFYCGGAIALVLSLAAPSGLFSAPLVFSGWDDNAGVGSPLPNSDAALRAFIIASPHGVGSLSLDNQPLGFTTLLSLDPARGISLILSAGFIQGYGAGITTDTTQPQFGFNTTPPGGRFLRLFADGSQPGGGAATFQFFTPQHSFGFYVTGIFGDAASPLVVEFNDGQPRGYTVPDMPASTAQFFGVVSQDAFTSVNLRLNYPGGGYLIGLDDLQFDVPEPPGLALGLTGILFLTAGSALRKWRARG